MFYVQTISTEMYTNFDVVRFKIIKVCKLFRIKYREKNHFNCSEQRVVYEIRGLYVFIVLQEHSKRRIKNKNERLLEQTENV